MSSVNKLKKIIKDESVGLLTEGWKTWNTSQKKQLLKARGLNESWAETKSMKEMVERGGGMIARDLHSLVKEWQKRNPGKAVRF